MAASHLGRSIRKEFTRPGQSLPTAAGGDRGGHFAIQNFFGVRREGRRSLRESVTIVEAPTGGSGSELRPPQLEQRQLELWRILRARSSEKLPLADWYLGAIAALRNTFNPDRIAQAAHSLRELLEKIPRALRTEESGITGGQLKNKREAVRKAFKAEKVKFGGKWQDKIITPGLENVLQGIEQYFDLSDRPDRRDQVLAGLTRLDPMLQTLPAQLRQEKRQRYVELWIALEGFAHHGGKKKEDDFTDCVVDVENLVVDLIAPVSADDQTLLSEILAEGASVSREKTQKALELITRRGANFAFFFKNASDPVWIGPLKSAGHFKNPARAVPAGEGYVSFPIWWPGEFLKRVAPVAPKDVVEILLEMGDTDNPRVLETVVEIALSIANDPVSLKLERIISKYLAQPYHVFEDNLTSLIAKWAGAGSEGIAAALRLSERLIFFSPDPLEEEKNAHAEKNPDDWTTSLSPAPRFQEWEYQQILENGVGALAVAAPLETAKLLIRAVAQMVRFETGKRANNNDWRDGSEIWAPRVDQRRGPYSSPQSDLVTALTQACEKVYDQSNEIAIRELDNALRAGKWEIFDRIRYHLYSKYPSKTKEWISEAIAGYADYSEGRYGFEFQRMVRIGTEKFGESLIGKAELTRILEAIFNGPDKDEYKRFMGEQFTEEAYVGRKRYFQLRHFRPFASILFNKYKELYEGLHAENAKLTDDDFVAFHGGESKTGGSRSVKPVAELSAMEDDDLISFLNEWEDVHRDPEQWWIDIDFDGVGLALQQLIAGNPKRYLDWGKRWFEVKRPVYFRYVLDLAAKRIVEHKDELSRWFDLADWIMLQKDSTAVSEEKASETSKDNANWDSARRKVVDLVEACVDKDKGVGGEWRPRIIALLKAACVAEDFFLDKDRAVVTPRDYLTDAINTTRGRALEALLDYGYWVRRNEGEKAEVPEVFKILEERFSGSPPLAYPERALLGGNFNRIYGLSPSWTKENVSNIFFQADPEAWQIAFGTYLNFNRAYARLFELLRPQFEFALENLRLWKHEGSRRTDPVSHLGQHLLDYTLWGRPPLEGKGSLLQRFYNKTDAKQWAALFDHLGRLLKNTAELSNQLTEGCKAFFEFRLRAANAEELKEFTFWMQAECLDPEWRLNALSRTLDVTKGQTRSPSTLTENLGKLIPDHLDLVVECFAKLIEGALTQSHFYIRPEHIKPILKAGLASQNEKTAEAAKFARENLLRAGRSEFLNLDAIKDDSHWLEPGR